MKFISINLAGGVFCFIGYILLWQSQLGTQSELTSIILLVFGGLGLFISGIILGRKK